MTGEIKKFVVTLWVMRHFLILPGAPRACVDFCDPTAVSRFKSKYAKFFPFHSYDTGQAGNTETTRKYPIPPVNCTAKLDFMEEYIHQTSEKNW